MKVKFRVQHEVISGLRYLQLVKRKGVPVDKSDEMMVSPLSAVGWGKEISRLSWGLLGDKC